MGLIEEGRNRLQIEAAISHSCKEIFTSGTELLKEQGTIRERKSGRKRGRYLGVSAAINSGEPEVMVSIFSDGLDLDNMKRIQVKVAGAGFLNISRKGVDGKEEYTAQELRAGYSFWDDCSGHGVVPKHELERVEEYKQAFDQLKAAVQSLPIRHEQRI